MSSDSALEYWLRGLIENIPDLLQPVAHALLQAQKEIENAMTEFPDELIWQQPAGVASVGFHLQHIAGVIDRLFTYARGEQLNEQQLNYLKAEGNENSSLHIIFLVEYFNKQLDKAIHQLRNTDKDSLTQARGVGRKQVPSTVLGLLFHCAEHTMRHTGQLLVTAKIVKARDTGSA